MHGNQIQLVGMENHIFLVLFQVKLLQHLIWIVLTTVIVISTTSIDLVKDNSILNVNVETIT